MVIWSETVAPHSPHGHYNSQHHPQCYFIWSIYFASSTVTKTEIITGTEISFKSTCFKLTAETFLKSTFSSNYVSSCSHNMPEGILLLWLWMEVSVHCVAQLVTLSRGQTTVMLVIPLAFQLAVWPKCQMTKHAANWMVLPCCEFSDN